MQRRIPAKLIAIPAGLLAAWIGFEGFSPHPYVPTKGDVPTIGHGSTYYEDGTRVTLADPPISRQRAAQLAKHELEVTYGTCVRNSLGNTPITETEFKLALGFAGQYGCGGWKSGPFVTHLKSGQYKKYCEAFLGYKYMTSDKKLGAGWEPYSASNGKIRYRFDCSTPGNKQCRGVWTRQLSRYNECIAAL